MRRALPLLVLVSLGLAPSQPPVLDPSDKLAVTLASEAGQVANVECSGLDSFKRYESARARVTSLLAAKYSGFTLNWQTGLLEPKK